MKESVGKSGGREVFFAECLLDWLSPEELQSSKFLLLLGENPRELPYTDALGVPRERIYSVERDERIFKAQLAQDLKARLQFGELSEYLESLLDGDQDFRVLNLDIEGSYLSQLDASMTPVLLISWRNPNTVLATYSSIGRDTEMLWEGVKSLAVCLWLSRERTLETLASLTERYRAAGWHEALHLALRDLFWVRSQLEHALVASTMMGVAPRSVAENWFAQADLLWRSVVRYRRQPLRLRSLVDIVDTAVAQDEGKREIITAPPPCLGIAIGGLRHLVYNGEAPWSQLCWFTKVHVTDHPVSCRAWLNDAMGKLLKAPLIYFDRAGQRRDFTHFEIGDDPKFLEMPVWRGSGLYSAFKPRRLELFPASARLIQVCQAAVKARKESEMRSQTPMTAELVTRRGELTEAGKAVVQNAGRKYRNQTTEEIRAHLPAAIRKKVPELVLRAHVAVGRRKTK